MKLVSRIVLIVTFACFVSLAGTGCSQNCCKTECTDCKTNCSEGCKGACCKDKKAEGCPAGCTKPCCKKA